MTDASHNRRDFTSSMDQEAFDRLNCILDLKDCGKGSITCNSNIDDVEVINVATEEMVQKGIVQMNEHPKRRLRQGANSTDNDRLVEGPRCLTELVSSAHLGVKGASSSFQSLLPNSGQALLPQKPIGSRNASAIARHISSAPAGVSRDTMRTNSSVCGDITDVTNPSQDLFYYELLNEINSKLPSIKQLNAVVRGMDDSSDSLLGSRVIPPIGKLFDPLPVSSFSCNIDHDNDIIRRIVLAYCQRKSAAQKLSAKSPTSPPPLHQSPTVSILGINLFMDSVMTVSNVFHDMMERARSNEGMLSSTSETPSQKRSVNFQPPTKIPQRHWILRETFDSSVYDRTRKVRCSKQKEDASVFNDLTEHRRAIVFPSPNPSNRPEVYYLAQTVDLLVSEISVTDQGNGKYTNTKTGLEILSSSEDCYRIIREAPEWSDKGSVAEDVSHALKEDVSLDPNDLTSACPLYHDAALQLWDVIDASITEIVRQITPQCTERGALLDSLRSVAFDIGTTSISVMQHCKEEVVSLISKLEVMKTGLRGLDALLEQRNEEILRLKGELSTISEEMKALHAFKDQYNDMLNNKKDELNVNIYGEAVKLLITLDESVKATDTACALFYEHAIFPALLNSPLGSGAWESVANDIEKHDIFLENRQKELKEAMMNLKRPSTLRKIHAVDLIIANTDDSSDKEIQNYSTEVAEGSSETLQDLYDKTSLLETQTSMMRLLRDSTRQALLVEIARDADETGSRTNDVCLAKETVHDQIIDRDNPIKLLSNNSTITDSHVLDSVCTILQSIQELEFSNPKDLIPSVYAGGCDGITKMLQNTRCVFVELVQRLCALALSAEKIFDPPLMAPIYEDEACPLCGHMENEIINRVRKEEIILFANEGSRIQRDLQRDILRMRKDFDDTILSYSIVHNKDYEKQNTRLLMEIVSLNNELQKLRQRQGVFDENEENDDQEARTPSKRSSKFISGGTEEDQNHNEIGQDDTEKYLKSSKKYLNRIKKGQDHTEKDQDHTKKGNSHTEKHRDHNEKHPDHNEKDRDHNEKDRDHNEKEKAHTVKEPMKRKKKLNVEVVSNARIDASRADEVSTRDGNRVHSTPNVLVCSTSSSGSSKAPRRNVTIPSKSIIRLNASDTNKSAVNSEKLSSKSELNEMTEVDTAEPKASGANVADQGAAGRDDDANNDYTPAIIKAFSLNDEMNLNFDGMVDRKYQSMNGRKYDRNGADRKEDAKVSDVVHVANDKLDNVHDLRDIHHSNVQEVLGDTSNEGIKDYWFNVGKGYMKTPKEAAYAAIEACVSVDDISVSPAASTVSSHCPPGRYTSPIIKTVTRIDDKTNKSSDECIFPRSPQELEKSINYFSDGWMLFKDDGGNDPTLQPQYAGILYPKHRNPLVAALVSTDSKPLKRNLAVILQQFDSENSSGYKYSDRCSLIASGLGHKTLTWLLKVIAEFYRTKLVADLTAVSLHNNVVLIHAATHLTNLFRNTYGTRQLLESNMEELILCCSRYVAVDPRVGQFVRFLTAETDSSNVDECSEEKERIRQVPVRGRTEERGRIGKNYEAFFIRLRTRATYKGYVVGSSGPESLFFFCKLSRAVDSCTVGIFYMTSSSGITSITSFNNDDDHSHLKVVSLACVKYVMKQTDLILRPYAESLWGVICQLSTFEDESAFKQAQKRAGIVLIGNELHPKDWSENDVKLARMTVPKIIFLTVANYFEEIHRRRQEYERKIIKTDLKST